MSQYPKKNPLSMQLDLSKFTLATEDEKKMADRMRESTSFFKDGMRRLRKNVVSMICLIIIVLLILIAFVVPLFYPYDYSTSSASVDSVSANFLAPMKYSIKEQILRSKNGVFIGWSYPRATLEGYKGLPVIDSQEKLDEVKEYFVTDPVKITNSNVELYAVWSVDENGDGIGDLRGLLDAIRLVHTGLETGDALTMCLTNKTFDAYERRLVSDTIAARIPQDLRAKEVFL